MLELAALFGSPAVVELILQRKARFSKYDTTDALFAAVKCDDLVALSYSLKILLKLTPGIKVPFGLCS